MNKVVVAAATLAAVTQAAEFTLNCVYTGTLPAEATCAKSLDLAFMNPASTATAATFTYTAETAAANCAALVALDDACVKLVTGVADATPATADACIKAGKAGVNKESCGVKANGSCATVDTFTPVCAADLECINNVCATPAPPVTGNNYVADWSAVADQVSESDVKKSIEYIFDVDESVDQCKNADAKAPVINFSYASVHKVVFSSETAIPQACLDALAVVMDIKPVTAANEGCVTKCGTDATVCPCEADAPCGAPADPAVQGPCPAGSMCEGDAGAQGYCSSSVVASAALAVAAAVLAVIF